MPRAATYNRVSKKETARNTEALIRQQWQTATEAKEYDPDFLEFTDQQTGRRDDRPEFQKVFKLIQTNGIDRLYVTRIDRITRDVEMNARMAKLFEKTGVEIYELMLGRILDFKNPEDWKYFVNSGVSAEAESRMLSNRIHQTYKWLRNQGKPAGGGSPLGYQRSSTKFIEPCLQEWDDLIQVIKIIIESGGSTAKAAVRVREETGWDYTRAGLYDLMRSQTIRGHTVYPDKVLFSTHKSVFDDPELAAIDALTKLDRMIAMAKHQRGSTRYKRLYPLSGLVKCGRCNGTCHIKTMKHGRYPDKEYTYICCGNRQSRAENCGGEYGSLQGMRGTINTPYPVADAAVIQALRQAATEMVNRASSERVEVRSQESVESKKLREQIQRYESLDDPDLLPVIEAKRKQWRDLISGNITPVNSGRRNQEALAKFASIPNFWDKATNEEKDALYHDFVECVLCDRLNVVVKLRV